jgi:hypothetical protein
MVGPSILVYILIENQRIDEQQQHELNPPYTLGRVPQQSTASSSS